MRKIETGAAIGDQAPFTALMLQRGNAGVRPFTGPGSSSGDRSEMEVAAARPGVRRAGGTRTTSA